MLARAEIETRHNCRSHLLRSYLHLLMRRTSCLKLCIMVRRLFSFVTIHGNSPEEAFFLVPHSAMCEVFTSDTSANTIVLCTRLGRLRTWLSPAYGYLTKDVAAIGVIWKPWLSTFKWGIVAPSTLRSGYVATQNVELICLTPALLKNMIVKYLFVIQ